MRMDPETRRRLESLSKETGRSLSALIDLAVATVYENPPDDFALYADTGRVSGAAQTITFAAFGKFFVRGEMSTEESPLGSCYTYRVILRSGNTPATPETFPSLRAAFIWMRENA